MAGSGTLSSPGNGIHLTTKHDGLLLKISRYFKNIDQVNNLAIYLFQGSPTGGQAFVDQLDKGSTVVSKAYKVLDGWRTQYYEQAYGRPLYEVLRKPEVNQTAAMECKAELCPPNPDSAGMAEHGATAPDSNPVTHSERQSALKQGSAEAEDGCGSKEAADKTSEEIPTDTLLELASRLSCQAECVKLAGKLDFKETEIIKVKKSKEPLEDLAQDMLLKWSARMAGAIKRSLLVKALENINRPDLAKIIK